MGAEIVIGLNFFSGQRAAEELDFINQSIR
jgi:hypothetical protein